jgi:protein O-mannosyl-transferase
MSGSVTLADEQSLSRRIPIMVVMAGVLAIYGASLGAPFHLDDYALFSDPTITSPSGWWSVWRPLQTRPLTYFTFWLNYQLGGQNAIGYHAANLALHLFAVWLLYPILVRLLGERPAWIAVALFALHPIQTEAVVYVFARAILLATVFCLLALRSWLNERYWAAAGWFVLALLSKEECVAFPFFLLLIRRAILPCAGMLCLSIAAGCRVVLALKILHISGAGASAGISPLDYFTTQGIVILRYFRLLLAPYGFTCDPDIPIVRDWHAWVAWVAILGLAVLFWKWSVHGRWFAAGLILLAPSSTIFAAQDLSADRRLYLPMLAFASLGGLLLSYVDRRITISVVIAFAAVAFVRAQVWRSERTLWVEAVKQAPNRLRPRILLARASDVETASGILDAAEAMAPNDPRPAIEKGLRFMAVNRPDSALVEFDHALALAPDDPMALNNHGAALSRLGRGDAAIEDFRHALRINPCWASARRNLELLEASYPTPCR